MITYTVLSLYKRFEAYETLGALFRDTQKELLEKSLCERIATVVLFIIRELLEIISVDIEQTMYLLTSSGRDLGKIKNLLIAVNQLDSNSENYLNTA